LVLEGGLVGDIDEALTVVLDTIDCQDLAISPSHFRRGRDSSDAYGRSCYNASYLAIAFQVRLYNTGP
jgi:hypothetical protein